MKKLLPVLLALIGLGAGGAAGWFLQPQVSAPSAATGGGSGAQETAARPQNENEAHAAADTTGRYAPPPVNTDTIRMPNQFVVPLIEDGRVRAMVVIGIAMELEAGHSFSLTGHEPRLRAVFLQLLFDHANLGGFDGVFTSGEALLGLRRTLREAARIEIGSEVNDVLITELLRQES